MESFIRLGLTHFATTFDALKSLHNHKHELQVLVTCELFKKLQLYRSNKAKEVMKIILDEKFWNDIFVIIKIVGPLVWLLYLVDSDEKPALSYIYEGMYRACNEIKETFQNKKKLYKLESILVESSFLI